MKVTSRISMKSSLPCTFHYNKRFRPCWPTTRLIARDFRTSTECMSTIFRKKIITMLPFHSSKKSFSKSSLNYWTRDNQRTRKLIKTEVLGRQNQLRKILLLFPRLRLWNSTYLLLWRMRKNKRLIGKGRRWMINRPLPTTCPSRDTALEAIRTVLP